MQTKTFKKFRIIKIYENCNCSEMFYSKNGSVDFIFLFCPKEFTSTYGN